MSIEQENNNILSELPKEVLLPVLQFHEPEPTPFVFYSDSQKEILKFDPNGDIFVKGKLIENDKEVVEALREFLKMGTYSNIEITEIAPSPIVS